LSTIQDLYIKGKALLKDFPDASIESKVLVTDISSEALKTARQNAFLHEAPDIVFLEGILFSPLQKWHLERPFDFIVSNPPYVSENQWETLQDEIRLHEPIGALVPGKTGLEIIENLVSGALNYIKKGGASLYGNRFQTRG